MDTKKAIQQALYLFPWETAKDIYSVILYDSDKATVFFKDGDVCHIF